MTDTKVNAVRELDLSLLISDLVCNGLDQKSAERAVSFYREFLVTIAAYPEETVIPSKLIDKVWHAHMHRPKKYYQDCMLAFGEIIDHTPGVYGTTDYVAAYELTRNLVPYEMAADYRADSMMAGAECWRQPQEPGEGSEDPLTLAA